MSNRIGPIILDNAIDFDGFAHGGGNTTEVGVYKGMRTVSAIDTYTRTESFVVTIPTYQYTQLLGLVEQEQIVYIDGSSGLNQEYLAPKGWYFLVSADINTLLTYDMVQVNVSAILIEKTEKMPLEIDYTMGTEDGTSVEHGYGDDLISYVTSYRLNEDFDTYDTTDVWYAPVTSVKLNGAGATPIGGALNMIGAASPTSGATPHCWTTFKTSINPPFNIDWGVNWVATPTNKYYHTADLFLTENRPSSDATFPQSGGVYDYIRMGVALRSTGATYFVHKNANRKTSSLVSETGLSNNTTPAFRIAVDSSYNVTFYSDPTRSGTYTSKWGPGKTSVDVTPAYLTLAFTNLSSTSRTVRFDDVKIYKVQDIEGSPTSYTNVVPYPASCTPSVTPNFTRTGVDCIIPYCVTPTSQLNFVSDQSHIYDGSVKAYSSNNATSTPRQVMGTDEAMDTTTFNVHNSLIKVEATPPGVNVYAATSPTWTLLNTFSIGTGIYSVKVNDISPDHATIQFNDTYWEIYRGKPHVYVTHTTTPLVYTKKDYYLHDAATLTTPAAGASVTMDTNFFTLAYNTADTNRLMILQKEPTTIKTDSIPATELTGIGYYPSTGGATPTNWGYLSLAKQWVKRTETRVRLTRP